MKVSAVVNKAIKILVATDFLYLAAFGLTAPIFAVFVIGQIKGGDVKVVGFATALYWIVKSLLQMPIAKFLDKTDGETDDFWALFFGYLLSGLAIFILIFSRLPWHIYLVQILQAIGMAFAATAWPAIFTRHIDKGREAYEWSLENTYFGFSVGISGALGGLFVSWWGFKTVFLLVGIFSCLSTFLLLFLIKHLVPQDKGIYAPKIKKPL